MNADTFIVDGRAYSWRRLCELRREQVEAQNRARLRQLALFELRDDCRPLTERTAADRYQQPSLLDLTHQNG